MRSAVSFKEKMGGGYVNLTVDTKYWLQKNILNCFKYVKGHKYINKPMTELEWEQLSNSIYGNQYIAEKYHDEEHQMRNKRPTAQLIHRMLNSGSKMSICDAGANAGYLMKAFWELGYDVYGFDILENKDTIVESENDIIRKNYKLGSILDIPRFNRDFDIVTAMNVFEHIPINYVDKMANELLKLRPRYFVFEISKDAISDGHITLKGTNWWVKKFKNYRVMKELEKDLKEEINSNGERYQYTGVPRNAWNGVPGIVFLERE